MNLGVSAVSHELVFQSDYGMPQYKWQENAVLTEQQKRCTWITTPSKKESRLPAAFKSWLRHL